ncbi:hypothetical protein ACN28S_34660 [Cystobacter fuscus]
MEQAALPARGPAVAWWHAEGGDVEPRAGDGARHVLEGLRGLARVAHGLPECLRGPCRVDELREQGEHRPPWLCPSSSARSRPSSEVASSRSSSTAARRRATWLFAEDQTKRVAGMSAPSAFWKRETYSGV